MGVPEVLDIAQDAIYTLLMIGSPIMGVGLAVGLIIALIQALTSIQEMTLVFVPKIFAIFLAQLFFMPFMIQNLTSFMDRIAQHPDLKVIFISGYAEDAFRRNLDSDTDFELLPKPFSLKQLAGRVKDVTGG